MNVNNIYNEDCLDTMSRMPDGYVDMVMTSPPYSDIRDYEGFKFDFEKTAQGLYRVLKEGGVCVWVVGDKTQDGNEKGIPFSQALYFKELGFALADTMIYQKTLSGVVGGGDLYRQTFEFMFVFSKGKIQTKNLIKDYKVKYQTINKTTASRRNKDGRLEKRKKYSSDTMALRGNVWLYSPGYLKHTADVYAYEHPAMFPEKLAHDHIVSWSNLDDIVYDPFMGAGTTAKVAVGLGRKYIGSEISARYCEIANRRSNCLFG